MIKFYIASIKHHVSPNIVETKQISKGENRKKCMYSLNEQLVLQHLELNSLKNSKLVNINERYKHIYLDRHGADNDTDTDDD